MGKNDTECLSGQESILRLAGQRYSSSLGMGHRPTGRRRYGTPLLPLVTFVAEHCFLSVVTGIVYMILCSSNFLAPNSLLCADVPLLWGQTV